MTGIFPTFTTPGEVAALQTSLRSELESVRSSLQRCATAGTFTPEKTPADWDSWQGLKSRVQAYVAETPSLLSTVSQYERGEALQLELGEWRDRAKAFGCDVASTPKPPVAAPLFAGMGMGAGLALLLFAFIMSKK